MWGPPIGEEGLRELDGYERMVDAFAEQAKVFWRMWGPPGKPMIRGIEAWAEMQHAYIQWLRQTQGSGSNPSR